MTDQTYALTSDGVYGQSNGVYADALGAAIPDSGVSRWTFDDADTDGSTAIDVWGSYDGTINGATTGVSGQYNEAYQFDGTDDQISIDSTFGIFDGSHDFSVSVWLNSTTSGDDQTIFTPYAERNVRCQLVAYGSSNTNFGLRDTGNNQYSVSGTDVRDGNWHHIVFIFHSGGTIELYEDGSLEGQNDIGVTAIQSKSGNNAIGGRGDGYQYVEGTIDDVRVYEKALSATEVSNLNQTGSISG